MNRRDFTLAAALAMLSFQAGAQDASHYPDKPVRIVVGFPAGQATDIIARLVSENMAQRLGQPLIVENKPGVGGGLALSYLAQQPADGHTVSFANTGAIVTNPIIQKNLPYQPQQLQPVALLGDIPLVLVARGDGGIESLEDFIEKARAQPGRLTYGTPGNGTTSHLAMESLKQAAGIDVLHIPYTGSSRSLTDVAAGNVDVSFDTITTVMPFTANGRLKPLAIGATDRVAQFPELPTLTERNFPDIVGSVWVGAFVPKGTPQPVIDRLDQEIGTAVKDPAMAERLAATGLYVRYADSAGYARILQDDTARIRKVVSNSGIRAE